MSPVCLDDSCHRQMFLLCGGAWRVVATMVVVVVVVVEKVMLLCTRRIFFGGVSVVATCQGYQKMP